MLISAVIITLNEEKNIGRCLDSLQGVADEILILDSQSTDRTKEICATYGVRFVDQEWLGYAATKNRGHELASHPYILSLDADEALSEGLRNSILAAKEAGLTGAYACNRLNHYAGKPIKSCGWYPDRKVRLFAKGTAQWTGEFVHETLAVDNDQMVHFLEGDLLHFTYSSREDHIARARKYARLAAQRIAASGKPVSFLKRFLSPAFRFVKMYFFLGGIFDGKEGYWVASITAREVYWKYKWAREI